MQEIVQPGILKRLHFDHHSLVWRVVRHQPAKVRNVGERYWQVLGKLHEGGGVPRRPSAQHLAIGVVERCRNSMLSPQAWTVRCPVTLMRFLAPRHAASMCIEREWRNPPRPDRPITRLAS